MRLWCLKILLDEMKTSCLLLGNFDTEFLVVILYTVLSCSRVPFGLSPLLWELDTERDPEPWLFINHSPWIHILSSLFPFCFLALSLLCLALFVARYQWLGLGTVPRGVTVFVLNSTWNWWILWDPRESKFFPFIKKKSLFLKFWHFSEILKKIEKKQNHEFPELNYFISSFLFFPTFVNSPSWASRK